MRDVVGESGGWRESAGWESRWTGSGSRLMGSSRP